MNQARNFEADSISIAPRAETGKKGPTNPTCKTQYSFFEGVLVLVFFDLLRKQKTHAKTAPSLPRQTEDSGQNYPRQTKDSRQIKFLLDFEYEQSAAPWRPRITPKKSGRKASALIFKLRKLTWTLNWVIWRFTFAAFGHHLGSIRGPSGPIRVHLGYIWGPSGVIL